MNSELRTIAERFESFARNECAGYSPLYVCLAEAVARDPAMLALAAHSSKGVRAPPLLVRCLAAMASKVGRYCRLSYGLLGYF
jgi:hypothetical protein